jgi:hypothetical protein
MSDYDPRANSAGCYAQAVASLREIAIRRGNVLPAPGDATEARWAAEGERPINQLETVRA